jgi:hypothetical protein
MFQGVVKPSSKDKLAVQNVLKVVNFNLKKSIKLKSDDAHILRFAFTLHLKWRIAFLKLQWRYTPMQVNRCLCNKINI